MRTELVEKVESIEGNFDLISFASNYNQLWRVHQSMIVSATIKVSEQTISVKNQKLLSIQTLLKDEIILGEDFVKLETVPIDVWTIHRHNGWAVLILSSFSSLILFAISRLQVQADNLIIKVDNGSLKIIQNSSYLCLFLPLQHLFDYAIYFFQMKNPFFHRSLTFSCSKLFFIHFNEGSLNRRWEKAISVKLWMHERIENYIFSFHHNNRLCSWLQGLNMNEIKKMKGEKRSQGDLKKYAKAFFPFTFRE